MPLYDVCPVPPGTLREIFDALNILGKIDAGELTSEDADRAPGRLYRRGFSYIKKHRRRSDLVHVATTHVVTDASGTPRHRHGKDIVLSETRFIAEEP